MRFRECSLFALLLLSPHLPADDSPWWDHFPTILRTSDPQTAQNTHAIAAMNGIAGDPSWGLFVQRHAIVDTRKQKADFAVRGIRQIAYFEGYGECTTYITELRRDATGAWIKEPQDSSLTQFFNTHWTWPRFDGKGEIHWVGIHDYFDDTDFARPWTRLNPTDGAPPMRYPDGRIATGYNGSPDDPRNSRILDAGCSKDVLGNLACDYGFNEAVNRISPDKKGPTGPITGLLVVHNIAPGPPDPGFTPEEWKRLKSDGYAGHFSVGKDAACPSWIDALRVSIRQAAEAGADGAWVDNYSPWDNFGTPPVSKAFGDWSVAGFRDYLSSHFSPSALKAMQVGDPTHFDVRAYLQAQCTAWSGDPKSLTSLTWRDPRWLDDPVWRAYLIYKRQAGEAALSNYYHTAKTTAAAAGKPDFLIMGNDIPGYSLGWVRGELDMVSTELSWEWGLTSGPHGFGPPPGGSYVPVYKLAREHARSRFVTMWPYVPPAEQNKPNIARVLYYQGLANHAIAMTSQTKAGKADDRSVGEPAANAAFFDFVNQNAALFDHRMPVEEIGLYYSSSSQLMEITPGGFRNHADQPHSFSFYGWGTALTELHLPWRAIPEWKLNAETLRSLRLLIVPESAVFDSADAAVLTEWVHAGHAVIMTGKSGIREGESHNFDPALTLAALIGDAGKSSAKQEGKGWVLNLPDDPGRIFYQANSQQREGMLDNFHQAIAALPSLKTPLSLDAPEVPATVGLTLYHDPGQLFIDANNTNIDLVPDVIQPTTPLHFTVTLPEELRGQKLTARVISPDIPPTVQLTPSSDRVEVSLSSFQVYASVLIEAAK